MPQASTISKLATITEEQWGFVTRRQAEKADVSPATLKRLIRDGVLERTGPAVYRLAGAPAPDHVGLRSAWLQLAPDIPVWERRPNQGTASHRSAAAMYGIGHLPADVHEFILPPRRDERRRCNPGRAAARAFAGDRSGADERQRSSGLHRDHPTVEREDWSKKRAKDAAQATSCCRAGRPTPTFDSLSPPASAPTRPASTRTA
jgi:hypothetical protein